MFRIDDTTASATLPTPSDAGTPGYFSDGNPTTATPPTTVPAEWFNMIQEELIALLVAAAVNPSKSDRGQLLKAIAQGDLAAGWFQFPLIGLTVNLGGDSITDASSRKLITFAKPFIAPPTFHIAGNNANGPPAVFHGTGGATTTQMNVYSATASGVAAPAGTAFYWLAIGR